MDQIQIINLGLGQISQRPIEDLNEQSVQAETANLVWEPCLRECLQGNNWPFATAIEALATVSNYTAPSGWAYAYAYPSTAIAVWRISNSYTNASNRKGDDFREIYVPSLKSKVLLTNCYQAYAEYTYYLTDTTLFNAVFVNVLAFRLAAAMAMPLNADQDQALNLTKIFQNQMSEAQRTSNYENNVNNGDSATNLIDARTSGIPTPPVSIGGITFDQYNSGG